MALIASHFHGGVFYTRFESHLTQQDAQIWAADLSACAAGHGGPVVALLDLSKASKIAAPAYILLADVARSNHVSSIICVAQGAMMTQAVQMIAAMSERGRIQLFETMREARLHAEVLSMNAGSAYA